MTNGTATSRRIANPEIYDIFAGELDPRNDPTRQKTLYLTDEQQDILKSTGTPMWIMDSGYTVKADLDDTTNPALTPVIPENIPVAGDLQQQQTATNSPVGGIIGEIMALFSGVINAIGGLFA